MRSIADDNFRNFFKNNIDFLIVLDLNGNIVEINDTVFEQLGYSDVDVVGKSVLMMYSPEYGKEILDIISQALNREKSFCQIPLLANNNEYIPVETYIYTCVWDNKEALLSVSRNMTELEISEEKFKGVFNQSQTLMSISTVDAGFFININQKFIDMLGYTRKEILGKTSKDLDLFYDYKDRQRALDIYKRDGRLEKQEVIIKTKSGELRNCIFSFNRLKIQTQEYLLISATDVTEQKKAESKVRKLYFQQTLLSKISQLLNTTIDLDSVLDDVLKLIGELTDISRVYVLENVKDETNGRLTHEWSNIGIEPLKINNGECIYEEIPSWKKLLLNQGRIFSNNIEMLPEDLYQKLKPQGVKTILVYPLYVQDVFWGSIVFHECASAQTYIQEGLVLLKTVSSVISKALERKQALEKLKKNEMRLKLVIESAQEWLWDCDIESGKLFYSSMWSKMLGYSLVETEHSFLGWKDRIHPEDFSATMLKVEKLLNGETELYEAIYRVKTKSGDWKWVLDHGMVVQRDMDNKPVRAIGTTLDITSQKKTEQKLKKAIDTQNKLFSIIAHDLRGPIGNIIPIVELLSRRKDLDEASKAIFLEELKKSTKSTFGLLENLLSWSRSQTNSITLKPVSFSVNSVIYDNVDLLSSSSDNKSLNVSVKIGGCLSAYADKETVSLVVRNILSNAIKFTPENGTINISAIDNGQEIEIEIADSGVGMKKEVVDNLFSSEMFISTFGTNNEKGSGLGLVLCKDFVKRNGGQIRVESILGKGSKFVFTIPRQISVTKEE